MSKKKVLGPTKKINEKKKISIAIQGAASHGAYTWGILERLLEKDLFEIRGICGASSGALIAAVTTYGLHVGGNKGAIDNLAKFWHFMAEGNKQSFIQPSIFDDIQYPGGLDYSPGYHYAFNVSKYFSPYDWEFLNHNPNYFKDKLNILIDFEELKKSKTKLFVCATNIKTLKSIVFGPDEITIDTILASAALPLFSKAIEIDGEFYWDGGYLGNPPIEPLIYGTDSDDLLLLKINPTFIKKLPTTSKAIADRGAQIILSTSLMAEMRMLAFQNELVELGYDLKDLNIRKINYHEINGDEPLADLGMNSKLNNTHGFLNRLRKLGHEAADKWVEENYDKIGVESSVDLKKVYT